jgi:hypothetical protein
VPTIAASWDDAVSWGLKLIYLVATWAFACLRLAWRDSAAKDVEILMLRHQLAVAQRRDPRIALAELDRSGVAGAAGGVVADRSPAATPVDRHARNAASSRPGTC